MGLPCPHMSSARGPWPSRGLLVQARAWPWEAPDSGPLEPPIGAPSSRPGPAQLPPCIGSLSPVRILRTRINQWSSCHGPVSLSGSESARERPTSRRLPGRTCRLRTVDAVRGRASRLITDGAAVTARSNDVADDAVRPHSARSVSAAAARSASSSSRPYLTCGEAQWCGGPAGTTARTVRPPRVRVVRAGVDGGPNHDRGRPSAGSLALRA